MNKECSLSECEAPALSRGMCNKHYKRWWRHGDPNVVVLLNPGRFSASSLRNLPNPWVNEAPACPRGCPPLRVYLWAAEGTLRWLCASCQIRFDAPTSQVPQTVLVSGT